MTENTTPTTTAVGPLIEPVTGEVIDLANAATTDLAQAAERLSEYLDGIYTVRQAIADEVARRLDTVNSRSERIGDYVLKTNAPTTESYDAGRLRDALDRLVAAGKLDAAVIDRILKTTTPEPVTKVDGREVNKLKRHHDPEVLAGLAAARTVSPQRRTLKVERAEGDR